MWVSTIDGRQPGDRSAESGAQGWSWLAARAGRNLLGAIASLRRVAACRGVSRSVAESSRSVVLFPVLISAGLPSSPTGRDGRQCVWRVERIGGEAALMACTARNGLSLAMSLCAILGASACGSTEVVRESQGTPNAATSAVDSAVTSTTVAAACAAFPPSRLAPQESSSALPPVNPAASIHVCAYRPSSPTLGQVIWTTSNLDLNPQLRSELSALIAQAGARPPGAALPGCIPEAHSLYDIGFSDDTGTSRRLFVDVACALVVDDSGEFNYTTPDLVNYLESL